MDRLIFCIIFSISLLLLGGGRYLFSNYWVGVIYLCVAIASSMVFIKSSRHGLAFFFLSFAWCLMLVLFLMAGSPSDYGIYKAIDAVGSPFISLLPVFFSFRYLKVVDVKRTVFFAVAVYALCVFVIAVVDKSGGGFWVRDGRYGIYGPIVFGWFCSLGVIACFNIRDDKRALLAMLLLLFGVYWSGSKGPLLSLLALFVFWFILHGGNNKKVVVFCSVLSLLLFYSFFDEIVDSRQVQGVYEFFVLGRTHSEMVFGSFFSRFEYWGVSLKLVTESPIVGVGVGGWADSSDLVDNPYPHNLALEVMSEFGLFVFVYFFLYWVFLIGVSGGMLSIVFFLSLCLMFSGDLSYFKYVVYFSMLGCLFGAGPHVNNH